MKIPLTKKLILTAVISALVLTTILTLIYRYLSKPTITDKDVKGAAASAFEKLKQPLPGIPKKLQIESVGIDANVVSVVHNDEDVMETPNNLFETGWYVGSNMTQEEGNIVINGHYDGPGGTPAVFWELKNVSVGDKVSLIDDHGRPFSYTVTDKYYVDIDSPDRFSKVFDYAKGQKLLTLITCGGVWLPSESTYNKRLIIRAQFSD